MHLPFMKETRSKWEKNAQVQIAKEGLKIDATQIYEDFFIGKLHLHPVGFEPRVSLFTKEMPFMSKLIGTQPNEDAALLVQCPTYNI